MDQRKLTHAQALFNAEDNLKGMLLNAKSPAEAERIRVNLHDVHDKMAHFYINN